MHNIGWGLVYPCSIGGMHFVLLHRYMPIITTFSSASEILLKFWVWQWGFQEWLLQTNYCHHHSAYREILLQFTSSMSCPTFMLAFFSEPGIVCHAIEAGECCKQTELVAPPANFTHNDCNFLISKSIVEVIFLKDCFHFSLSEVGSATFQYFWSFVVGFAMFLAKLYICSDGIFNFL